MEWIKYVVFSLIVIPVVLIGLWKTGKQRTVAFTAAGVLCLLFGSFLMNQPDEEDIKAQIQKNVTVVKPYLAKEFPGEKWTISTVPFQNEPDAAYEYKVNPEGRVELSGFHNKNDTHEFKHLKHD